MAIVTNLDPQKNVTSGVYLLVEDVSIDEEVWDAVIEYLENNSKSNYLSFSCNFRINSQGTCFVQLLEKIMVEL